MRRLGVAIGLFSALGCAEPTNRVAPEEIWDQPVEQIEVQEPVDFRERSDAVTYGLPAAGQPGLGDVVALLPGEGVGRDDPNMWVSESVQFPSDVCQGGGPAVVDDLPITLEAVVALHPRQYVKVPICDQDERNYGTFVITDDTGGIAVLRDARVAEFTFGDRVRVTVNGIMQAYGDPGSRYIILADIEPLPAPLDEDGQPSRPVIYEPHVEANGAFELDDIGFVRRVEGWVAVAPTNNNFNDLVISSRPLAPTDVANADAVCIELCRSQCATRCPSSENAVCTELVCPEACQGEGTRVEADDLPACWAVGIDAELGRRGFGPQFGEHVAVTGPVVRGFQRQNIWMIRLGQFEALDSPGDNE